VRKAFDGYIRQTAMALNGVSLPDAFDNALVAKDAEEMREQIEAAQAALPSQPMAMPEGQPSALPPQLMAMLAGMGGAGA